MSNTKAIEAAEAVDFDIKPDKQFEEEFEKVMDYEIPEKRRSSMIPVTLLVVGLVLMLVAVGALTWIHVYGA